MEEWQKNSVLIVFLFKFICIFCFIFIKLKAFGSDKITTGASSDFQTATNIAVQMIKVFGMNEKVGIRVYDNDSKNNLSPQTQELLDQEIKKQLNDSYERARIIIKNHSNELKLIADALLKHETLDVDQIKLIIDQKNLN